MGIRLMNFQDDIDKCLASIALEGALAVTDDGKNQYQAERRSCYQKAGVIPGFGGGQKGPNFPIESPSLKLTNTDYENIRALVTQIWNHSENIDIDELRLWLKERGFRTYP